MLVEHVYEEYGDDQSRKLFALFKGIDIKDLTKIEKDVLKEIARDMRRPVTVVWQGRDKVCITRATYYKDAPLTDLAEHVGCHTRDIMFVLDGYVNVLVDPSNMST